MSTKPQIKISEVLSLLDQGMQRAEIKEHYGLSAGDLTRLFQHPLLKGKKAKKQPEFELIDDVSMELTTEIKQPTDNEEDIIVETEASLEEEAPVANWEN